MTGKAESIFKEAFLHQAKHKCKAWELTYFRI